MARVRKWEVEIEGVLACRKSLGHSIRGWAVQLEALATSLDFKGIQRPSGKQGFSFVPSVGDAGDHIEGIPEQRDRSNTTTRLGIAKELLNALQYRVLRGICNSARQATLSTHPLGSDLPYGWSLEGISNNAGNACSYRSTVGRIFSAIWCASE